MMNRLKIVSVMLPKCNLTMLTSPKLAQISEIGFLTPAQAAAAERLSQTYPKRRPPSPVEPARPLCACGNYCARAREGYSPRCSKCAKRIFERGKRRKK